MKTPSLPDRIRRRRRLCALCLPFVASALHPGAALADTYVPPPAATVTGYFEQVMPCKLDSVAISRVVCKGDLLQEKTLRELSILRNTIYARYGWDGYRKPWLKAYFHSQPWFHPNASFSYKLLSDADKKNAHFIGVREQAFRQDELEWMKSDVLARHGKVWGDVPEWKLANGKTVKACSVPKDLAPDAEYDDFTITLSKDCHYRQLKWYKADRAWKDSALDANDKVELGLIARSMGSFALDDEAREKTSESLDRVVPVSELRQLSLRDLRLLRNTIYARRGRHFKSEVLRDHFQGMRWYKEDPAYTDKRLTRNDERNIGLIKSVENEFGGPLSDEDWLTEPAVDGA